MNIFSATINKVPYIKRYSEFITAVTTVTMGGVLAQAIGFISAPIIARLFIPEHFGVAALFGSIAGIFNQASTLTYPQAIILSKEEEEALSLAKLSTLVLFIFVGAFFIVSLGGAIFFEISWYKKLGIWFFIIPLYILLLGLINVIMAWNIREKRFMNVSKAQVTEAITQSVVRIAAALISGSSVFGLISGFLCSAGMRLMVLLRSLGGVSTKNMFKPRGSDLLHVAKSYVDFPLYVMPAGFMNAFTLNLPVIAMVYFFDSAVIGLYAMAGRLLLMPTDFILQAVNKVYFRKAAEILNEKRSLRPSFIKTTIGLMIVAAFFFSMMILYGEKLFVLFLGERWAGTGKYAILLSPWLFSKFILPPSNAILVIQRKNRMRFYIQLLGTLCKITALVIGLYVSKSPEKIVLIYSLTNTGVNFLLLSVAFRDTGRRGCK